MRFRLDHPTSPRTRALYGHDPTGLGFWAEVRRRGSLVAAYDGLHVLGERTTISGVLVLLVGHGFLEDDDLHEAMQLLPHMEAKDIEALDVRRAAEVIERLRAAASEG